MARSGSPHPQGNAAKGRKRGVPNKFARLLKEMVLESFVQAGGVDYLVTQARRNPVAFLALLGRVLPIQVKEGGAEPIMPKHIIFEYHTN